MAQFTFDFGSLSLGSGVPTGMTDRWAAGTWAVVEDQPTDSGHAIEGGAPGGEHRFLSLDDVGEVGDVDVYGKVRAPDMGTHVARCGFIFRGGGGETTEDGYQTLLSDTDEFRLNRYINGSFHSFGTSFGEVWDDKWVYFHFQAEGENLRVKAWTGTLDDEPGTWGIDVTDTNHSTGWLGLSYYSAESFYWDWIAIGTEGDPAPVLETFTTDFSELPVDVQISGHENYTTHWNTGANEQHYARSGLTGETGGRHIAQESTVNNRRGVAWDVVPTDATKVDVRLRAQYLAGSTVAGNTSPGIVVHGGGGDGTEDALRMGIQDDLEISQWVGGTNTSIGTASITLPSDGTWFWLRFQVVNGGSLRAKYWLDSDPEPLEWMITEDDPGSLTSGWVGIWSFHGDNATPVWDDLVVEVDGDVEEPAQYFYDWGSHSNGTGVPTGWSEIWKTTTWEITDDVDADTGKALFKSASGGNDFILLAPDEIGTVRDADIICRVKANGFSQDALCGLAARGSNSSDLGLDANGYQFLLRSSDRTRMNRHLEGGFTGLGSPSGLGPWVVDTYLYMHLQVIGDRVRGNAWNGTLDDEPATWQIDVVDDTVTSGQPGVSLIWQDDAYTWDWVGIGVGGATALTHQEVITDGLQMAFDATDLDLSDTDSVTTWPDGSGNGRDLTGVNGPTYRADVLNGNPVVRFDGTDDHFTRDELFDFAQPNMLFVVCRFSDLTGDRRVMDNLNSGDRNLFLADSGNLSIWSGSYVEDPAIIDTDWHIFRCVWDGASSAIYVDGSERVTGDAGLQGFENGIIVGALNITAEMSQFFEGDIAEFLFYDRELTSQEITDTESYLTSKWLESSGSWTAGSELISAQVSSTGSTAQLDWDASPTANVQDYSIFRRTPPTGAAFDPETDTPIAAEVATTAYDDEDLAQGEYEWQVIGRVVS